MGFERNYPVKILSYGLNKYIPQGLTRLFYSKLLSNVRYYQKGPISIEPNLRISPWFITGFSDGEASFIIKISKSNSNKIGFNAQLFFQIALHSKDHDLLKAINSFFGVGSINTKHGPQSFKFYISSIKDLAVIIEHFDKYPLLTQKHADYKLFKEAFYKK